MQPEAQTTTRGSHTVSAGAFEVKGSFKALKEMLIFNFNFNLWLWLVEGSKEQFSDHGKCGGSTDARSAEPIPI
jgi:hypothetical protein